MRKTKVNRKGYPKKEFLYDNCQTPFYAIDPLLPYLKKDWLIWESACGAGNIVKKLEVEGYKVIGTDIIKGQNFFEYKLDNYDCMITNPPYSVKYAYLKRCYELGKPFGLLMPVDVFGSGAAQGMFDKYGIEVILLSPRINFFMPNLGYFGKGAHFSTAWFTWKLDIGKTLSYAKIHYYDDRQMRLI